MAEKAQIMCVAQIIAAPATAALSSSLLSTQLSLGLVLTKAKQTNIQINFKKEM